VLDPTCWFCVVIGLTVLALIVFAPPLIYYLFFKEKQ
jgi:Na+-driven multidrug efflux pump